MASLANRSQWKKGSLVLAAGLAFIALACPTTDSSIPPQCRDPQASLKVALRGETSPLLEQAQQRINRELTPTEIEYLARFDWGTATESQIRSDPVLTKGVAAVRTLVRESCPSGLSRRPGPSAIAVAYAADDGACLVGRGNANAIAAGITGVGSIVACAATTVGAPLCVAGTLLALALVLDSGTACAAERNAGGTAGGGTAGGGTAGGGTAGGGTAGGGTAGGGAGGGGGLSGACPGCPGDRCDSEFTPPRADGGRVCISAGGYAGCPCVPQFCCSSGCARGVCL
jgi:hypothetical protein